tara:strand:+ start:5060 stop:5893 length:834 start_codon:yes stop_codon:yes gene_type:complete
MNHENINKKKDDVLNYFGNGFMDDFHDYPYKDCLWRYQHRCRMEVLDDFLSKFSEDEMIGLDAGSGKGPSSMIMSKYINLTYSIENEMENVERQISNFTKLNPISLEKILIEVGDITKIKHPDNSFDIIICSEVLEHIENYEAASKELYRVLKPGGTMLFSMPNKISAFWQYDRFIYHLRKFVRKIKGKPSDWGGYPYWEQARHWEFSSKNIRDIVLNADFRIVEERGLCNIIFNEWVLNKIRSFNLFNFFHSFDIYLGKKLPRFSSIYYLVLSKDI